MVARGDLSDAEWELVEPFLPVGERGPVPDLRRQFNGAMWRFRAGRPRRDLPEEYGSWSTVYGAFQRWAAAGTFRTQMDRVIAEAAARRQADLDLVSVDSTVSRAYHHAAGMVVDPDLLEDGKGELFAGVPRSAQRPRPSVCNAALRRRSSARSARSLVSCCSRSRSRSASVRQRCTAPEGITRCTLA
ncbi:transposase [Streptomyces sp. NPDC095613]|uniref:transposase n=1 Tax=Streptomyces sp. NPDC095613 TaxID=3155540 RepID=UPI003318BF4D